MSEVDKYCSALKKELIAHNPLSIVKFPKDEEILVRMLQDEHICNAVRNVNLNDTSAVNLARERFSLAANLWTQQTFGMAFKVTDKTRDAILYFCIVLQKACDDLKFLPTANDDLLNLLRKLFAFDRTFLQPCRGLFQGVIAGDDNLPLHLIVFKRLKQSNLEILTRIGSDIKGIQLKMNTLHCAQALQGNLDYYYCGSDCISHLEQKIAVFEQAITDTSNGIKVPENAAIPSISLVEAVYHVMVENEPAKRQEVIDRNNLQYAWLKNFVMQINPDYTNPQFVQSIQEARSVNQYLLVKLLSDATIPLNDEGMRFFEADLIRYTVQSQFDGPEKADIRTAQTLVKALCDEQYKTDNARDFWMLALEALLSNQSEASPILEAYFTKKQQMPKDVQDVFARVRCIRKMVYVIDELFSFVSLRDSDRANEIRMILARTNLTNKLKLQMISATNRQYAVVSGLVGTIIKFGILRDTDKSQLFKILDNLNVNQVENLDASLQQLNNLLAVKKAEEMVDKRGVIGQLETIDKYIREATFEILKTPSDLSDKDLNLKVDAILVFLEMLVDVEDALVHAEHFSPHTVAPAKQYAIEYKLKLTELLEDAKFSITRRKLAVFQGKLQELLETPAVFLRELETLRKAYYDNMPNMQKLPKLHQAAYDKCLQEMNAQIDNLNELEHNLPQGLVL